MAGNADDVTKYFDNVAGLIDTMSSIFPEEGLGVYRKLLNRKRTDKAWEQETLIKVSDLCQEHRERIRAKDERFFRELAESKKVESDTSQEERGILEHIGSIWTNKRRRINKETEAIIWKRIQTMCGIALRYTGKL